MTNRPFYWLMAGVTLSYLSAYAAFVLESLWVLALAIPAGAVKAHALRLAFDEGADA